MTPEQEERLVCAAVDIASALLRLASVEELRWSELHQPKTVRPEVTVTRIRTPEEIEREATLGGSESSIEDWTEIGERERKFDEEYGKEISAEEAGRPRPAED